jgi:hypothetical protein
MDWMIIAAAVIGGWMMLSVLSGERMIRAKQVADAIAKAKAAAAAEQAVK